MPATTSAYRRIEAGAIITLNDGTTTWTLTSVEPGSLSWELGWYKPLPFTERGVLQTPYEGDERQGKMNLKAKYAGANNANDLAKAIQSRDTTNGKMRMWTMVIKNPDYKGAATGEQLTFANLYLDEGGLKIQAGTEYDMIDLSMVHNATAPSTTTY